MQFFSIFSTPNKFIISATFSLTTFSVIEVLSLLFEDDDDCRELTFVFVECFISKCFFDDNESGMFPIPQDSLCVFSQEIKVSSAFYKTSKTS